MPGIHKDVRKLAAAVNAAGDGWQAEVVENGKHASIALAVTHHGQPVTRVSGHASGQRLALTRAVAELRRAGCPLPHHQKKKKEADVPALTSDEKRRSAELLPRLDLAAEAEGSPSALAKAASALLEEYAPELQFGRGRDGANPEKLADTQLRAMLSRTRLGMKESALESWEKALDLRAHPHIHGQNGSGNGAAAVVPEPAPQPEPVPEPEPVPDDDPVDSDLLALAEDELKAAAQVAEALRRDVAERDLQVEALKAQLETATERLSRADEKRKRELKDLEAMHQGEMERLVAKHQEKVATLRAGHEAELAEGIGTVEIANSVVAAQGRLEEEVDRLRAELEDVRRRTLADAINTLTRLTEPR